jgi:glyoxylase-like metal-dependent hydrolase (beta-lactamase superfamily II)
MDGRPHPPAWAPHTWNGFSTGEWVGNTLVVTTTHLKDGYLKRSGPQTSDAYTMTEYITRNGDYLTVATIVDDPIYLAEPYVQTTTFRLNVLSQLGPDPCTLPFDETGGKAHAVPHYLPQQNPFLTEWLEQAPWIPREAAGGGVDTLYPEYRLKLSGASRPASPVASPSPRPSADRLMAGLFPHDGEVHVQPVQRNVYMLIVDGFNIAASIGQDGAMLVDTGPVHMSDKVLAAVRQLSTAVASAAAPNQCAGTRCPGISQGWSSPFIHSVINSPAPPKPLRYIVNTSASLDRTGGNEKLAPTGSFFRGGGGAAGNYAGVGDNRAAVIAHEKVLLRMSGALEKEATAPQGAWPTDTYWRDSYRLHQYFNGEPVLFYHMPAAHTDGDTIAYFRGSEVISAGNIYWTTSYPIIDLERGGSIDGIIDGLNRVLDLAVAENMSQGGTWIIPGRGRLADTADVASYRNMMSIIRDRVRDLIGKRMTLDQVKAARPTFDFDGRYGSETGSWTTEMFVEAVYKSLIQSDNATKK